MGVVTGEGWRAAAGAGWWTGRAVQAPAGAEVRRVRGAVDDPLLLPPTRSVLPSTVTRVPTATASGRRIVRTLPSSIRTWTSYTVVAV
jgi:hypothetical protein